MIVHIRIAIACALLLFTSVYLNAQTITWQRTYGDSNIDYGYSIVQTPDGGYIAVGRSAGIFVMRLNTFGDTLWTKVFVGGYAEHVIRTLDNNYVLMGTFANIVKFNIDGFMIWNEYYGDNGFRPTGMVQTKDSCLVICGLKEGVVTRKPCLIKLDSKGKLVYRKEYLKSFLDGDFRDLTISYNGDYVMIGNCSDSSVITDNLFLLRTDSAGNELQFKSFDSLQSYYMKSLANSDDGGYFACGRSYLMRFGEQFKLIWKNRLDSGHNADWRSIIQTNDGGYAIVGTWDSTNNSSYFVRLYKFNSHGIEEWRRSFGFNDNDGAYCVRQTCDSGYVMIGIRDNINLGDIYIIKSDKNGNSSPVVKIRESASKLYSGHMLSQNFPNPFNSRTVITFYIATDGIVNLKVSNVLGQELSELINARLSAGRYYIVWDSQKSPSGVYFYSLYLGEKLISFKKMILLN